MVIIASIAVQLGHVNGPSGASYEEETLKLIVPHVVARLRSAGHQVTEYDGRLQGELGNYQYQHDGAIFCHCDSNGGGSTFSVGYWEEVHPGSQALAGILQATYHLESGIAFGGFNITIDEAHYYGNRRFVHSCKCTLIEFGFVSNPVQRAFLQNNAQRIGYAAADAYVRYFGGATPQPAKPIEEDDMQVREIGNVTKAVWIDCYQGKCNYYVTTDGAASDLKFKLEGHKPGGGSGTTEGQSVSGLQDHNIQDILKQDRMKDIKGSFKLTVACASPINISIREVPK